MALEKTGSPDGCEGLNCPGIWTEHAQGYVEVQGDTVTMAGLPEQEGRVRVDLATFDAMARQHLGITA